ncbi:MAG: hypothetical protein O4861_15320 [Trichodesmium sp. St16_bin4-tuft]|nr:hypothetical protein [Trichodesmium sp. St5_bin8]MDE5099622.1 hypothetical protein [Trichodesmium sp. St16_bin4-tuft]
MSFGYLFIEKNLLLFTSGAKYIDNYVKLTGVNIMKVIDSYIDS